MKILQFPLMKITIWFIMGIIFSYYSNAKPTTTFLITGLFFVPFILTLYLSKRDFIQKIYFGFATYLLFFQIGSCTQVIHNEFYNEDNYIHLIKNETDYHTIELVLREKLKGNSSIDKYIGLVKRLDNKACSGKMLVQIPKTQVNSSIHIGSSIQINGKVISNKKSLNPNQFDYGKYLNNKSIFAKIYAKKNSIKIGDKIDRNIWYYSAHLRNKIITALEKNNFSKEELQVVSALILGQQQDISKEILKDYQYAGAIHILSVSGLHVGFILLFITFLLKPLRKDKLGNTIRLLTIIISLWGFAILAGLSPSVVRSVTMFSFVAVGMYLKRNTNIFHTLLVSMFLILFFQPSFLFDVGFQLSYLSLFFILWLQPVISNLWEPKNKIVSYFWDILTVSFAAQIGAFPLSIFYFHQFPGLFFITNLIIIPFLILIMGLGILVMVLAAFDFVPMITMKSLEFCLYFLNKIINWVASFEQFIIKDIPINWQTLFCLYLLIIAIIVLFKKPSYPKIVVALFSLLLFQTTLLVTRWEIQNQHEWIVFNSWKNTLITERNGVKVTVYGNDNITAKIASNSTLKSYLIANNSKVTEINKIQNLYYFNDKKIMVIDSFGIYSKKINPDIIILRQSPKINLERLIEENRPKLIIADASNYKTNILLWKSICIKRKIPFHATAEKGFYSVN
ncbi:MAG: ComEC family competence protein [Flavobacterium sp.]|nr:ComEC family competence protein [Flavobacterium sp.]